MKNTELKDLLNSLTVKEKIGRLVQLSGEFFGGDVATGPQAAMGIEPWVVENLGSALNVVGARNVLAVQRAHMLFAVVLISRFVEGMAKEFQGDLLPR